MALGIEAKKQVVAEVSEVASEALSAVVAEYRGLTVADMTALRVKARENGVYLRVIRNTLAKRAVEGTEFACMQDAFTGPVLCAFSKDDPGAAARLLKEFSKEYDDMKVTALAIGGNLLDADQIDAVASLPTYEQALAQLMSVMNGPITKLTRTLNDVPGQVVRVVAAVKDAKAAG
ncbi:MAG: 50S ribosomal protein L10 [Gammaproteobacteria bacterium]|nr:50S ribosomal protein L10 [Gammaproteobacteria bacterium]NNJ71744.1 50S ribosomal protein L10 [Enterobacterales bacterium]